MIPGNKVKVSDSFPITKAKINNLVVGDTGTVKAVFGGIALVRWDKGYVTSANIADLIVD
jgi:hypothetical protein